MSEMVERVARALCRQTCYAQNSGGGCDACTFYLQHEVESRAAIEAMRDDVVTSPYMLSGPIDEALNGTANRILAKAIITEWLDAALK